MALSIICPESEDQWEPFEAAIKAAFGDSIDSTDTKEDEAKLRFRKMWPLELRVGVVDEDEILGGCVSYEFSLTLPGGSQVPAGGLAAVGIDPTKTGRGGLKLMMAEHLRLAKSKGMAASTLLASETGLYKRFGYGWATSMASYEIDSARAGFLQPLADPGSLELLAEPRKSRAEFEKIYGAIAETVPGTTSRSSGWWELVLDKEESWLGGGKQLGVLHRNAAGEADGYLLYDLKRGGTWVTSDAVNVRELLATNTVAELALFQFAANVPLTRSINWTQAPVDTPVRHHLADPRQLKQVDLHDLLWVRPLDVPKLLTTRSYLCDGTITLEVDDPVFEDQRGPWSLSVTDGAASVSGASGLPDLTLTPEQLGSVVLGETRVCELAAAGVLSGPHDAVNALDRLLLTERRPFNLSKF